MARNSGGSGVLSYHPSAVIPERRIAERVWTTPGENESPEFGVVILHGAGLHSGWYGEVADEICAIEGSRARVSCAEFPSHGSSYDTVEGYRGYVPDCGRLVQEAVASIKRARDAIGVGKKLFLLGESLGALIAMTALVDGLSGDTEVEGVILTGALLGLGPALAPPAFAFVLPIDTGGETFDSPFGDPHCAKLGREDPLTIHDAPVRVQMLITVLDTMKKVQVNAPEKVKLKSLLYVHYTRDEHTSYEATKAVIDSLIDSLKHVPNIQAFPVDAHAHQLFQDVPEKSRVHIKVVTDFIEKQLGS